MENALQYIADVYHRSNEWGIPTTEEDMYIALVEWNKEKDEDDYCPSPSLYKECAAYWNQLCELYPN